MAKRFQVDTNGTLLTGLVSYFKLEDGNDFFGANHLTNYNTVIFEAGKIGNSAKFNGTTNYLKRDNVLSAVVDNWSMFGWVYVPTVSEMGCFFHNGTMDLNGYSIGVGAGYQDSVGNELIGAACGLLWHGYGINIGTGWHFVGAIRNAGIETGYVDNVAGGTTYADAPAIPTAYCIMGADGGPNRFWKDKFDEFGFWNKVLSAQERTDLYNGGAGQTMIDTANFFLMF